MYDVFKEVCELTLELCWVSRGVDFRNHDLGPKLLVSTYIASHKLVASSRCLMICNSFAHRYVSRVHTYVSSTNNSVAHSTLMSTTDLYSVSSFVIAGRKL